jgi:hypothetical protein
MFVLSSSDGLIDRGQVLLPLHAKAQTELVTCADRAGQARALGAGCQRLRGGAGP